MKIKQKVYLIIVMIITVVSILLIYKFSKSDNTNKKVVEQHLNTDDSKIIKQKQYTEKVKKIEDEISNKNIAMSYSAEEILLAKIVYAESSGCSDACQIAVASVVMNRVNNDKYPNTIYDVIYQEGQYEPILNGSINKEPDQQSMKNASYVYNIGSQIPSNVVFQSLFEQGSGVWQVIDNTYFCYM